MGVSLIVLKPFVRHQEHLFWEAKLEKWNPVDFYFMSGFKNYSEYSFFIYYKTFGVSKGQER